MGSLHSFGMAEAERNGDVSLYESIVYQLQHNHYPPVPFDMVMPCMRAVRAFRIGEKDTLIKSSYEHREYRFDVPASVFIEAYHLEAWV